jgi:hypothetical protein
MNTLVLLLSEFYYEDLKKWNGYNLVKLKQLVSFRKFDKIIVMLDKSLEISEDVVLKVFCKDLHCSRGAVCPKNLSLYIMQELVQGETDDFYVFMPVSAMNADNPLHGAFEKIQPDRMIRLCLIGIPDAVDPRFDAEIEFPPIANIGSVFEDVCR